jgi:hypothetical protein
MTGDVEDRQGGQPAPKGIHQDVTLNLADARVGDDQGSPGDLDGEFEGRSGIERLVDAVPLIPKGPSHEAEERAVFVRHNDVAPGWDRIGDDHRSVFQMT